MLRRLAGAGAVGLALLAAFAAGSVLNGGVVAQAEAPAHPQPDRYALAYPAGQQASLSAVLDGRYGGVGLWLRRDAAGALRVSTVLPASPAGAGRLLPGDTVLSLNAQPVIGRAVADVVADLRGVPGSLVTITVLPVGGGAARTVTLRRAEVLTADVAVSQPADGVIAIRVTAFTRGTGEQVQQAIRWAGAGGPTGSVGLVLDLRGNPGGLLDEAVTAAGAFFDGGPVVTVEPGRAAPTPSRTRGAEQRQVGTRLDAPTGGDAATPLVVLVDGGTASAAEVLTGALQDRGRAVVVGQRTFGKGSVQQPVRNADGSAAESTVAHYRTPAGHLVDGVGLFPDLDVTEAADADSDVGLAQALLVLGGTYGVGPVRS